MQGLKNERNQRKEDYLIAKIPLLLIAIENISNTIHRGIEIINHTFDHQDEHANAQKELASILKLLANHKSCISTIANGIDHQKMLHKNSFLTTIEAVIDQHIGDSRLSINHLCRAVYLERTQVYRKIKAMTNLSPSGLIKQKRMEKATELLKQEEYSIGQIASMCGYEEHCYFDRVFLDYYGVTPRDWRKKE